MHPKNQQVQKKEEVEFSKWLSQYHIYMRSSVEHRYTNIFIPKGTEVMLWYEKWQFNIDMNDFMFQWQRGQPRFYIPDHAARYDIYTSKKDVLVPMVLMSNRNEIPEWNNNQPIPESHIINDLYGEIWPIHKDASGQLVQIPGTYGMWMKLYEQQTYIPELGTSIIGYAVYEENLPMVNECFKYGQYQHGTGVLPYKNTFIAATRTDPLSAKGQAIISNYTTNWSKVFYPTTTVTP